MVALADMGTARRVDPLAACVYLSTEDEATARYMRNAFERHAPYAFHLHEAHAAPIKPCFGDAAEQPSGQGGSSTSPAPADDESVGRADRQSSEREGVSALPGSADECGAADEDLLSFRGSWPWGWLQDNPWGVPTEREVFAQTVTGETVYRTLLRRR